MSFAVIESKAGFNSAATDLLAAPEFVFTLDGAVVHASAKVSTAANERIAWIRFFILINSGTRRWIFYRDVFYAETWAQVKLALAHALNRRSASCCDVFCFSDIDSEELLRRLSFSPDAATDNRFAEASSNRKENLMPTDFTTILAQTALPEKFDTGTR